MLAAASICPSRTRPQHLCHIHVLQDRLQAVLESMRQQATGSQLSKSHDSAIVKQLQTQLLGRQEAMKSLQDDADSLKAELDDATRVSSRTQALGIARTTADFGIGAVPILLSNVVLWLTVTWMRLKMSAHGKPG